jgi:hypothetical protein
MVRLFPTFLGVLFLSVTILGQNVPENCPKLEVVGPRGMANRGEPVTLVLQSEQDFPEAYKYEWIVENGTIVSGQGTRVIDAATDQYEVVVRATVTVSGFPTGCSNSASASLGGVPRPHIGAIDEWGDMPNDDQRGRLDLFFAELANNPFHKGYIFIYSKNRAVERRRLKLYVDHVRFRKFDKSRLVFCLEKADRNNTRLYRIPPQLESEILEWGCKPISGSSIK